MRIAKWPLVAMLLMPAVSAADGTSVPASANWYVDTDHRRLRLPIR